MSVSEGGKRAWVETQAQPSQILEGRRVESQRQGMGVYKN
jgi:hypothetical protein